MTLICRRLQTLDPANRKVTENVSPLVNPFLISISPPNSSQVPRAFQPHNGQGEFRDSARFYVLGV